MASRSSSSGSYDRVALAYEERIVPHYTSMAKGLVAIARPRSGDRILDVGAGTGIVARLAEARVRPNGVIVRLDRAGAMLAVARDRMPRGEKATPWICLIEDSASMSLDSSQFDLVLGQFSFVEENPRAMREAFRVLVPGGRLALSVFGPDRVHDEYRLLAAARRDLGAPELPRHGSTAGLMARLRRAGFIRPRARQRFFPGVYADVDDYLAYRDAFPWRTVLARSFWRGFLPAVRRAAAPYCDRRGRVILRRSVTYVSARRPR